MMRISAWKGLAVAVGVTLLAATVCLVSGDTNLASALIVVAVLVTLRGAPRETDRST